MAAGLQWLFVSAEETEESNNKWRALLKNGLVKLLKLGVEARVSGRFDFTRMDKTSRGV